MIDPPIYPSHSIALETPRKALAEPASDEPASLPEYFLSEARGHYPTALELACACCEAMALYTPAGFARLPPATKPREPKPAPKTAL